MPSKSKRSSDETDITHRSAIVLAAGQGTRFKSGRAKVLHELCGKPLLHHVLDRLLEIEVGRIVVVVGHQAEAVRSSTKGYPVEFAVQEEQRGTGHAVQTAAPSLGERSGRVLVVYGDTPLLKSETLMSLYKGLDDPDVDVCLLTACFEDPFGYGRVVRDDAGRFVDIVEEKEASEAQRRIQEINTGLYCFRSEALLSALPHLEPSERTGDIYLTDAPRILSKQGRGVSLISSTTVEESKGVNDRSQLAAAERVMNAEIVEGWMRAGVTVLDPSTVRIDSTVTIGADTTIYPGTIIEGKTTIGPDCEIRGYCHIQHSSFGRGTVVDHACVVRNCSIGERGRIGPHAHLRQGASIGSDVRIGNFVEVKNSQIGDGSKAAHLSYLGDSAIGRDVNIGAGTITCNYDGTRKNRTVIEDGAFIGSNSQLIAPVTIGRGAYVAAGSTIVESIPADTLAIARSRQVVKERKEKSDAKSRDQ